MRKLIKEEIEGIDNFLQIIVEKYPSLEPFLDKIKKDIENSGCPNIELTNLNGPLGLALHNRLMLDKKILNNNLSFLIFILFHEIGHMYQFKKYGAEKMLEVYLGEMSLKDALNFIHKTEIVADEFGERKVREYVKLGIIDSNETPMKGPHKGMSPNMFAMTLNQIKSVIKDRKLDNPEKLAEFMYNAYKRNF